MPKLTVLKTDGAKEPYLHTKVLGSIANALGTAGQPDIATAQELAEAVTFFLYRNAQNRAVSTSEILSVIEAVLAGTGFDEAAAALSEYHFERKLKRCRIEVVRGRPDELSQADNPYTDHSEQVKSRWNKSRIVEYLVTKHHLNRQIARTVASMVEEKVFNMGLPVVPAGLVEQLVLNDAAAVLRAQNQLQTACGERSRTTRGEPSRTA
jgi:transcriptional regulator NrdR family protein